MTKIQKGEQRDEVNRNLSIVLLYFKESNVICLLLGCDGVIAELQNSNCSTSDSYPRRIILCTVKAPFGCLIGAPLTVIIDSNISYRISFIFLFGGIGGVALLSPS